MFDPEILPTLAAQVATEFRKNVDAALMKWLCVETFQEAIEVIEDLRCRGFEVKIEKEPETYKIIGHPNDFRWSAEWSLRFKIESMKEKSNG